MNVTLSGALHLRRVSRRALLDAATGLNDDLNGMERPVEFDIRATHRLAQAVCILWPNGNARRLHRYGFDVGSGIWIWNAIRGMKISTSHPFTDQWDWESDRAARAYAAASAVSTVERIVGSDLHTDTMRALFPALNILLATQRDVSLLPRRSWRINIPEWTFTEREDAFVRTIRPFLMLIGGALRPVSS